MGNCPCVGEKSSSATTYNSSAITWNGGNLCIGIGGSGEDLNNIIIPLANLLCSIQTQINTLEIVGSQVLVEAGHDGYCVSIAEDETYDSALTKLQAFICGLDTTITNLDTTQIVISGINSYCTSVIDGMTLTEALQNIITTFCDEIDLRPTYSDFFDNGVLHIPLNSYVKPGWALGTSGFNLTLNILDGEFWIDGHNITKTPENFTLIALKDNYLIIDSINNFIYDIVTVNIGDPQPSGNYTVLYKFTTDAIGVVSSSLIIPQEPINGNLIASRTITADRLDVDIFKSGLDFTTGTAVYVYIDDSTISYGDDSLGGSYIQVKDEGITKEKINLDVAGSGLIQNIDGSLSPDVNESIAINSDKIELLNDETTANTYYGVSELGTKKWYANNICYKQIIVPAANVNTINSNPFLLINGEADKYIQVLNCSAIIDFNVTEYTLDGSFNELGLVYGNDTNSIFSILKEILEVTNNGCFYGKDETVTRYDMGLSGENLYLYGGSDPIQNGSGDYGDSDLIINVWYRIV